MERLGDKYQVDELAAKYAFTGRTPMTIPQALEIKEELEKIDELLRQLEQARETAQLAVIDLDVAGRIHGAGRPGAACESCSRLVEDYLREMAERQGLTQENGAFQLTPQAYRLFQGKLLERIFSELQPSRTGRHQQAVVGEGAVELQQTKPYEFGDSITHMDIPQSLINAMLRGGPGLPLRLKPEDIEVHRTRNTPKCATVVIMDMSGSMRYDGQYINVKRMGLALNGLIRTRVPRRLPALRRDVHVRQAAARRRDRRTAAQAGHALRPGRAVPGGHEPRGHQRVPDSRRTSPTSSTPCSWRGSCCRPRTRPTAR